MPLPFSINVDSEVDRTSCRIHLKLKIELVYGFAIRIDEGRQLIERRITVACNVAKWFDLFSFTRWSLLAGGLEQRNLEPISRQRKSVAQILTVTKAHWLLIYSIVTLVEKLC